MTDPLTCPSCSFANALGAEHCAKCGTALAEIPERVHPGETRRDPDDLTLPPSPLLRAVLRGEADALASPRPAASAPAVTTTRPAPPPVTTTEPDAATVVSRPTAIAPVTPVAEAVAPMPVSTPAPASAAGPASPPSVTTATVEQLSPSADQAALLRELAERLHVRRAEPTIRYAGFFVRVVAFLVDGAVLAAFGFPLAAAGYLGVRAGSVVLGHTAPLELDESLATLLMAAWFAMAVVYFTVLHRSYGQTIGKSLLGLEVRTLDFGRLGFTRSLVRTLAYAV